MHAPRLFIAATETNALSALRSHLEIPMKKNGLVAPVLKWVGGKRQLLKVLRPLLPKRFSVYCEPFLGGGALLFDLQPGTAVVNDTNAELINVYQVVKSNVEELIADLGEHKNDSGYYYAVRDWDRDKEAYAGMSAVKRASRIIYLNKTCYNGLFRVNNAGEFNTPFGSYKNPNIVNAPVLRAVSHYLNDADVRFSSDDYAAILHFLPKGAFVYFDPPYFPLSETSNFTGYTKTGFGEDEQLRLKDCCDELDRRGVKFMLSNSAAPFVKELYRKYSIKIAQAKRAVNSVSNKRGDVDEVIVRNYG